MDNKILQDFSRLRVLQQREIQNTLSPATVNTMEDLAQDLTTALEASSLISNVPAKIAAKETRKSEGAEVGDEEEEDTPTTLMAMPSTSTNKVHSKRRALRRRCKSTSNLSNLVGTVAASAVLNQISDESSTSSDEDYGKLPPDLSSSRGDKGTSSLQLTESDDTMGGKPSTSSKAMTRDRKEHFARKKRVGIDQGSTTTTTTATRHLPIESDSVNENFNPSIRPHTKRKRKFKRMALDPSSAPVVVSEIVRTTPTPSGHGKNTFQTNQTSIVKRQKVRSNSGFSRQQQAILISGKRKRNNREKSVEPEQLLASTSKGGPSSSAGSLLTSSSGGTSQIGFRKSRRQGEQMSMDCADDNAMEMDDNASSSSLSSSEWASDADSDDVISFGGADSLNNGREADDEQSDWPGSYEVGGGGGGIFTDDDEGDVIDSFFASTSRGAIGSADPIPMTATARQAYLARMKRLAECVPGREIRAGTRKVRNRQLGFLIKSSSSEQLSRFLQDPTRSELRLNVLRAMDRNKIMHLANLYSLSVRCEGVNLLVLSKTGRTVKLKEFAVPEMKAPIEFKRRRRTPPNSPLLEGSSTSNEPPISPPDSSTMTDNSQIGIMVINEQPSAEVGEALPGSNVLLNRSESPILGASEFKNSGRVKFCGSLSS